MAYTLPPLPYALDALEPHYDAKTLEVHHGKHHAAYVDKLNKALADLPHLADRSIEALMADLKSIPKHVLQAVINNGGGHANHSMFWRILGAGKGGEPNGQIGHAIADAFGSFKSFRKQFDKASEDLFGSGYTFLAQHLDGKLEIMNLPNQATPISQGLKPILLLDVWEHAYYLKRQNRRPEWIEAFWNLVDWEQVERLYQEEPAWLMAPAG